MTSDERDERQQRLYDAHTENCIRFADRQAARRRMDAAHGMTSDHAHGNLPYLHSHTGERGMGFGHTLAEHATAGDLGAPAYNSTLVFVSGDYCALCNGQCVGHDRQMSREVAQILEWQS